MSTKNGQIIGSNIIYPSMILSNVAKSNTRKALVLSRSEENYQTLELVHNTFAFPA
jgi:hypothetical protein